MIIALFYCLIIIDCPFNDLTLVVRQQEGHHACKKSSLRIPKAYPLVAFGDQA